MTQYQPIFATRQALRIAALRRLLTGAGIAADPKMVYPEELERVVAEAGECLVIVDGEWLPRPDTLAFLRRHWPGSRIVIWTERLTADMLLATLEFGLYVLLSSRLPPEEAAHTLRCICRGERLMRFDPAPARCCGPTQGQPVAEAPSFDAQWMLDGAEPQGRET